MTRGQHPSRIGDFRLLEVLGEGGMGTVYRARRRSDPQAPAVAIKVLHAQYARNDTFRQRFDQEAELGSRLNHPSLVRASHIIDDGAHVALVMELVEGRPLSEMIGAETGPIPWARAWPLFSLLLDAVEYAHSQGVVHRDLKPDNVMVTPTGALKVLDFGIAKRLDAKVTRTGTGFGTVDYMAPEQYRDASKVDQRADIYALGLTLFHMVAGALPWESGESEFNVQLRKINGELPSPTEFYPHIPPYVEAAIQRSIAQDPQDRFPDIAAMRAALLQRTVEPAARSPWPKLIAGVAVAGLAALAVGATGVWWLLRPEPPSPTAMAALAADLHHESMAADQELDGLYALACADGWTPACTATWRDAPQPLLAARQALEPVCVAQGDPTACWVSGWAVLYQGAESRLVGGSGRWRKETRGPSPMAVSTDAGALAQSYLESACDQGHPLACVDLGVQAAWGLGVTPDVERAQRLFTDTCDAGVGRGCAHLADLALLGVDQAGAPDPEGFFALATQGCALQDEKACTQVGQAHFSGLGVPRDPDLAASTWRRACAQGATESCQLLGLELLGGETLGQRDEEAVELLTAACTGGQGQSCAALAMLDGQDLRGLLERACVLGWDASCWVMEPAPALADAAQLVGPEPAATGRPPPTDDDLFRQRALLEIHSDPDPPSPAPAESDHSTPAPPPVERSADSPATEPRAPETKATRSAASAVPEASTDPQKRVLQGLLEPTGDDGPAPVHWTQMTPTRKVMPVADPDATGRSSDRSCVVRFYVDEQGTPTYVDLVSCPPELHAEVLEATAQWRFQPHTIDGAARRVTFEMLFKL